MIEDPTRRCALLDLILMNKEGLTGDVKVKGSLGCCNYEMVELRILRGGRIVKNQLITLDFRRADFDLFRNLLDRVAWDQVLGGRGAQERWLIFKDKLLQV